MSNQVDDLIQSFNDNTNAVSARLDTLTAEIAAQGTAVTPTQLAALQSISNHLKQLGSDPSNPVPAVPAAVVAPTT